MKLKTRLTVAFLSIVFGTVFLVTAVFLGVSVTKFRSLEDMYGGNVSIGAIINSVQTVSESTQQVWDELEQMSREDPDQFENFSYLQTVNASLTGKLSYLLVMKDGELYYQGSETADWTNDLGRLGEYTGLVSSVGYYIDGSQKAMVKQVDIIFTDGLTGSAYIITTLASVMPQIRNMVAEIVVLILLVLIVVVLMISIWIYSGISRPIASLREAAARISAGDYDFTLEPQGDDEISQLCVEFEQMRQKLQETEAQKEKYDAENRELISNISHDLKTPITTVKGYVEGIMDGVADTPEKMDHYIKTIYNKANDMDRLVNELTFYSKIDTNRIPYNFTKLAVADFFDDCAEEVSIELKERNFRFSYMNRVSPDTVIIGDAEQLKRVMDNIIGNAVKYMDKPQGNIELRILDVGDFVQIEVQDNGKGIETKNLPHIFDRFYRTDASRSSATGGSGIGLSIVKKIIEDHSGRIWATSQIGRGTTVHFVIRKYISEG